MSATKRERGGRGKGGGVTREGGSADAYCFTVMRVMKHTSDTPTALL